MGKKKVLSLEDQLKNYEFANEEKKLLVKYKYHKRSTRYNALRNLKDEKPRSMNDQKYIYWLNSQPQSYYTANLALESGIPERILDLVALITTYHKPEKIAKADYELFVSRVLCYIAKDVVDRYFYQKLPNTGDWMTPEELANLDFITVFNDALSDFIYYEDKGYKFWRWNPEIQGMPGIKDQWYTQTSRSFRERLHRVGESFRNEFGHWCANGFRKTSSTSTKVEKEYRELMMMILDERLRKEGDEF